MAVLNLVGMRGDPVMSYNFVVTLLDSSSGGSPGLDIARGVVSDVLLGGFNECSGLEMSLDVHDFEEGGQNGYTHRFATRVKWSNITLKKGVGAGTGLWDWHYGFAEGKGRRRDGLIVLLNDLQVPNNIWYFRRGLPVRYTAPSLNAQESRVAIESVEIAHEGVYQVGVAGFGPGVVGAGVGAATNIF